MHDGGGDVLRYGGEVRIGDVLLGAEISYQGGDSGVVRVRHTGEKVVFNLIVQTTIKKCQEGPSHIARRDDLIIEKGLLSAGPCALIKNLDALKVMRYDKEEGQVEASGHEHGCDMQIGV